MIQALLTDLDGVIRLWDGQPEPQIFLAALAALRARPATTLYIDDSHGHVQAAAELGIISHVHTDYRDTEQFLARYGLL